jgi:hypothetical protein
MKTLSALLLALSMFSIAEAQTTAAGFRPPAVPLVTCDPYFSIWSFANHPAEDWTRHWTGANNNLCSMVRIDGKVFRLLSRAEGTYPAMHLVSTQVLPTRTIYEFNDAGVGIMLTFTTPLLPDDMNLVSRPAAYMTWEARAMDGKEHEVSVYYDNSAELVVNSVDQKVVWSRAQLQELDLLSMGSQDQRVLEKAGDNLRIDWGYFYVASPRSQNALTACGSNEATRKGFVERGTLPRSDDLRMPRAANDNWPVLAVMFDLGKVGKSTAERHLILAYDDRFSIEYFYRKLRPYWRKSGAETADMLSAAVKEYQDLTARCRAFDDKLMKDLAVAGGERYARIAALAYRQAFAAHKLAVDVDGTPLLFPKENFSNGCISTVDVIYPAAPIFLLLNINLMKALVVPVLDYARSGRWHFPFAPHDLGTYPLANGQVYGGGEKTEEDQMPVEESGNMLLLMSAIARVEGNSAFAEKYADILNSWALYLKEKGLDPENQLCTDDFAGHLAHNVNLSLKAILALGSYSRLCEMMRKPTEASAYRKIAEEYAVKWQQMAREVDHYRLAFDKPGTWSQKYNLVWDKILDLKLFPPEVAQTEVRFYKKTQNKFGLPLDNRKDYTKVDWTVWSATLADSKGDFEALLSPVYDFADQSPSRVPLTDWYDTKTAKQVGFQARSVIGGVFVKMLADQNVWNKWSAPSGVR